MKTDLFQSCGHFWFFQICWHIQCRTFTASSFRIWNSSAEIPSPLLALFVVLLSKAHLISHSRKSSLAIGEWSHHVVHRGSLKSFLDSSSVCYSHIFLVSSASVRSILFLSLIVSIFAWNVPLVSLIFLKWSLVFLILLFSFENLNMNYLLLKRCFSYLDQCITYIMNWFIIDDDNTNDNNSTWHVGNVFYWQMYC